MPIFAKILKHGDLLRMQDIPQQKRLARSRGALRFCLFPLLGYPKLLHFVQKCLVFEIDARSILASIPVRRFERLEEQLGLSLTRYLGKMIH